MSVKHLIDQLNVKVVNKVGTYYDAYAVLAKNGINVYADALAGGIMRTICSDVYYAMDLLVEAGYKVKAVKVIALTTGNHAGAQLRVLSALKENKISIWAKYEYSNIPRMSSIHIYELDQRKLNQSIGILNNTRDVELLSKDFMLLNAGELNMSGAF